MEGQKRKWNNYYSKDQRKKKQAYIESGMKGFLCTCNFREKECIKDAYKLLEKFESELINDDNSVAVVTKDNQQCQTSQQNNNNHDDDDDVSDALNKELDELKKQSDKSAVAKKFQYIDTGVKNCIFISTTLANPLDLAMKIFQDLDETKQGKSRFLLRLVPIQLICKANIVDIKAKSVELIEQYFTKTPKTFAIVINRHYNNSLQRSDVIETVAAMICEKNSENKADLSNPDIAIVVEIIKGHCLISIAPHYFKYKKYNLLELCNIKEETVQSSSSTTTTCDNENEPKNVDDMIN
ncbi:hypothetical protein HCN44_006431 [Aphidius gifuensis]|uniref:THUMP domain-containing protein n=1 Tax=Aphidius gifuensis TaxID=684658 RepID=A0A835CST2_APHGI|nr:THUMP domain-containing protein 1 homolog [Aphidius gifuensis]XP_044005377.1 THUMP domain-containing protein 1 homolog [Aphidius gifuensis]KAF7995324.1 hypothetical protein HCN44_006431 [Aphidius gifuensis]